MKTVLVVEDNPLILKFYRMALERQGGFRVRTTENVNEIVTLARSKSVDAVILDISLSNAEYQGKKIDGIQIARILREDPASADIPILVITAHAMEGDRERIILATGADDYLQKPIYDTQKLVAKINELIRSRNEQP
ncbi:MAG TPA: response regulator [Acidobacteriota bacterium]|jgi:CheY-like chemotaxis protein